MEYEACDDTTFAYNKISRAIALLETATQNIARACELLQDATASLPNGIGGDMYSARLLYHLKNKIEAHESSMRTAIAKIGEYII